MPSQTPQRADQPPAEQPPGTPSQRSATPWRTEGLPKGQPPNRQRAWITGAAWLIGYLAGSSTSDRLVRLPHEAVGD